MTNQYWEMHKTQTSLFWIQLSAINSTIIGLTVLVCILKHFIYTLHFIIYIFF